MTESATLSRARSEVFEQVVTILRTKLYIDAEAIHLDSEWQSDLDADSLTTTEFLMEVEDHFRIEISDERAGTLRTVGDAVDAILDLLDQREQARPSS